MPENIFAVNEKASLPATDEENAKLAATEPQINCTVIDQEFVKTIQTTAHVVLRASAEISNAIRTIDRECTHADDKIIIDAIRKLTIISGDLAEQRADLDLTLAAYDLLEGGAA